MELPESSQAWADRRLPRVCNHTTDATGLWLLQSLKQVVRGIAVGGQADAALVVTKPVARGRPHHAIGRATGKAALVQARLKRLQLWARERCQIAWPRSLHAGAADTSLMLAVDPRLVRTDRLAAAPAPGDGVSGDARPSTAALGQLGVELIVSRSVNAIRRAVVR